MSEYSHRVTLPEGTWADVVYMSAGDMVAVQEFRTNDVTFADLAALFERLSRRVLAFSGPLPDQPFLDQPAQWISALIRAWDQNEEELAVPPAAESDSPSPSEPAASAKPHQSRSSTPSTS